MSAPGLRKMETASYREEMWKKARGGLGVLFANTRRSTGREGMEQSQQASCPKTWECRILLSMGRQQPWKEEGGMLPQGQDWPSGEGCEVK